MKYIEVKNSNSDEPVKLSYCDHGKGKPVILIHGWPLSKEMWEYQEEALINAGFRVITYDRRGFGKSDKPWDNYDYDTLAGDLKAVIDQLDLRNVTLVGFSMGGGEVARYFGKYGGAGVTKVVLVSSILPFLARTADNKDGVPPEKFDEQVAQINNDRIGFLDEFGKQFFGVGLMNHPLSTPLLDYYRMLCSLASPRATRQCHNAFAFTDFRNDTKKINVPTLIIHGDDDKIVPIAISADKAASYIPVKQYLVYEGAPHGLFYTHKDRLNNDLVEFITTGVVRNNTEETVLVPGDENSIPVF
jgi:non-heme chloroperoxidase